MPVTQNPPHSLRRLLVSSLLLALTACSQKSETPAPASSKEEGAGAPSTEAPVGEIPVPATDTGSAAATPQEPAREEAPSQPSDRGAVPEVATARPAAAATPVFQSKPLSKAWPGRPYAYQITLGGPRNARLRLVQGPDSMRLSGRTLSWTPGKAGMHPVILEAISIGAGGDTARARQAFDLEVEPVFSLSLKPFPAQAKKGDTVAFDLRGSAFPEWAAASIVVRFDHDGDGTWDTPERPLAAELRHLHAFAQVGAMSPRVEARYLDLEIRTAKGSITITSDVDARLELSPDTAEPGGTVQVDASASKGDGRLSYWLDLDGDGKAEWADSAMGKGHAKAPASSGRYAAKLRVRNPMGLEGFAGDSLLVNARPRLTLKVRNPKENMAASVEALVEAIDSDDSLRALRINFGGGKEGWVTATLLDTAKGPGKWRKAFQHAYGRTGKFTLEACAASADGREACQTAKVEIFNAPPVVEPGADVKATLGVPAEIEGKGRDPDGSIVKWEWDLNGDGKYDVASTRDGRVKYTFAKKGKFSLNMRVTTADGMTATAPRRVEVRKSW